MFKNIIPSNLLFSKSARDTRRLERFVNEVIQCESRFSAFEEQDFLHQTEIWKTELQSLSDDHKALEKQLHLLCHDTFALVRSAARWLSARDASWQLVPYDVQLAGGRVLFEGNIAEMATGEGKTLTAIAPAYLRALTGLGVHIVTANEYLAKRDRDWMGKLFDVLGISTGCICHDQEPSERRTQYLCDITYGTASEFGFDYLRDQGLARTAADQVQRGQNFALVDEIDSILIDEARTPLIISGPGSETPKHMQMYVAKVAQLVREQSAACHEIVEQVRQRLKRGAHDQDLGLLLLKCQLAHPHHPGLRRLKQQPEILKLLEHASLHFHQDARREEFCEFKEDLLFWIDERSQTAELTAKGCAFLAPDCPELLQVGDLMSALAAIDSNPELGQGEKLDRRQALENDSALHAARIHEIRQLVKAFCLYDKGRHYLVENDEVIILDEARGRKMPGRRWSDGLHQAIEAKENVSIQPESETLASITVQNYFRLYEKLSGMTGTAMTDAAEFSEIYDLDVVEIPTHRPCQRVDNEDLVFKTRREKLQAIASEVKSAHARRQPVLVGTGSVDASETFSRILQREGIRHEVLNARNHEREAEIIAQAGMPGAITISTNMAGRGTDIQLHDGVADLGGLHVIGTERNDSRRVDRQLRGRSARQGDPGVSTFFLSLEDELVRRMDNNGRIGGILERTGHIEGEPLQHKLLSRSISSAQQRIEASDYERRRNTLKYDDVVNNQRALIYEWRNELVQTENIHGWLADTLPECVPNVVHFDDNMDCASITLTLTPEIDSIVASIRQDLQRLADLREDEKLHQLLAGALAQHAQAACASIQSESVSAEQAIRHLAINGIDQEWRQHLSEIEALRERIQFQRLAQKDPLIEFTREASYAFEGVIDRIRMSIVQAAIDGPAQAAAVEARILAARQTEVTIRETGAKIRTLRKTNPHKPTPQRNAPCPCGSERKFKKCCGSAAIAPE